MVTVTIGVTRYRRRKPTKRMTKRIRTRIRMMTPRNQRMTWINQSIMFKEIPSY